MQKALTARVPQSIQTEYGRGLRPRGWLAFPKSTCDYKKREKRGRKKVLGLREGEKGGGKKGREEEKDGKEKGLHRALWGAFAVAKRTHA